MELALFKERYPLFTDDLAIVTALSDAKLLLSGHTIPFTKEPVAIALMAAHILSVPMGIAERDVVSVKSDGEQVDFDKNPTSPEWLAKSGFGQQLMVLLGVNTTIPRRYGVIHNDHPRAINFLERSDFNGSVIGVGHDKWYPK